RRVKPSARKVAGCRSLRTAATMVLEPRLIQRLMSYASKLSGWTEEALAVETSEEGSCSELFGGTTVAGLRCGSCFACNGAVGVLVIRLPLTRRSSSPELATWIHVSWRDRFALSEVEKIASRGASGASSQLPLGGS